MGGAGADSFAFDLAGWGYDQVFDFSRAEGDRLDFRGSGITDFAQFVQFNMNRSTALIAPDGSRVDLYGVAGITAADCVFV